MSSSWKDKFLPPKCVAHEVGGVPLEFYPVTVKQAVKLRSIGGPLVAALTTIFTPNKDDVRQIVREFDEQDGTSRGRETIVDAIEVGMAEFRAEQRAKAIQEAFETVTDPKNVAVVGDVIKDSLRDDGDEPGAEIVNSLNVVQLREMLTGVAKANAEVFGPLAGKVSQAVQEVLKKTPGETLTTLSSS